MCWRRSFTSAPTISAAPSSNRSAFHWTATTSTDASSAPRRCWQIRGRRRPTSRSSWASAKRARSRRRSDTRLGPLQSTTAAPWHEAAPSQERRPKPAQQHLAGPQYVASRRETSCKLLDAHVGKADTLGGACGRSRRASHSSLTLPSGDQPVSAYAGGSTALKTISMSCSGKASLDTPIRLLAHRGRAMA
jgi:hypothetical protein